jgi:hypothetical protein
MHDLQRLIPAALQLASHQTIGRINRIILPTSMRRREVRLLERQIELPLCGRDLARLCKSAPDQDPTQNQFTALIYFAKFARGGVPIGADRDPDKGPIPPVLSIPSSR